MAYELRCGRDEGKLDLYSTRYNQVILSNRTADEIAEYFREKWYRKSLRKIDECWGRRWRPEKPERRKEVIVIGEEELRRAEEEIERIRKEEEEEFGEEEIAGKLLEGLKGAVAIFAIVGLMYLFKK